MTGGAGFIGSNMCEHLLRDNEVVAIDNFQNVDDRHIKPLLRSKNFSFSQLDITEMDKLETLKSSGPFDAVIHLAANSDVKGGSIDTSTDLKVNVVGTYNVLELARKMDIREIMFASSSTVAGEDFI